MMREVQVTLARLASTDIIFFELEHDVKLNGHSRRIVFCSIPHRSSHLKTH